VDVREVTLARKKKLVDDKRGEMGSNASGQAIESQRSQEKQNEAVEARMRERWCIRKEGGVVGKIGCS